MQFKDKVPFTRNKLDEEERRDTFTVALNKAERDALERSKETLEQEKDSTALKQLAWIGAKVIHEEKTAFILGTVYANKRKNKRLGIIQFEV